MTTLTPSLAASLRGLWKAALFFIVLAAGLWYVKWDPYYGKAFSAARLHSLGRSIIADGPQSPMHAALAYAQVYFLAVWKAAVLGVVIGSLVQVLIPRRWLVKTLGQTRLRGTLLGTLFALPGMMCTCCAAPVAAGMRRQSTAIGGTLAFWMANPLLNPATLVFMGFVLGWHFALIRLVAGIVMVLGVALLVQRYVKDNMGPDMPLAPEPVVRQGSLLNRWFRALWSLFWSTIPVYVVAVLALGAARVWWFPHADGAVTNTLLWVVAMAVVGTLFVIPTAAEIPIVQTMMAAGMGVAPGVALLMTLPAVSVPSLIMLRKVFPAKALWLTLFLVVLSGIAVGAIMLFF